MSAEVGVNAGLWWLTLGIGAVVVLVVGVLLHMITTTAVRIRGALVQVWVVGPMIANNTAHVDVLRRINLVAADILAAAGGIAKHTAHIQEHAEGCAGCPRCVTGWS